LSVSGENVALTWENSVVRYRFAEKNGQLIEIFLKMGVNKALQHGRGGGMTMHWNPDCYSKPRPWAYAHNWDIPQSGNLTEIRGPVFVQSTRWGALEPNMPEVLSWVTYRLYAHNPELRAISFTEVVQPISVLAIRNDEMIQDADLVSHYAFEETNGKVTAAPLTAGGWPEGNWIGPLDVDLPWIATYSPEGGHGLASVRIRHDFGHRFGKPAATDKAGTYINVSFGPGTITYWFRAYAIELKPERPLLLEPGAFYSESNAYLPFAMEKGNPSVEAVRQKASALRHPLEAGSEQGV